MVLVRSREGTNETIVSCVNFGGKLSVVLIMANNVAILSHGKRSGKRR